MNHPVLLILAAGMGSRYGGLKQIDPFGPGEHSLIEYIIYDAMQVGFKSFVFIVRPEIEDMLKEYFSTRLPAGTEAHYVVQRLADLPGGYTAPEGRKKPWGTAHAVFSAREVVTEPFAVVNCDDYYGRDALEQVYRSFQSAAANEYSVVGYRLDSVLSPHGSVSRGICYPGEKDSLREIVEHTRILRKGNQILSLDAEDNTIDTFRGDEVVSMNLFGFMPSFFPFVEAEMKGFLERDRDTVKSELYIPAVMNNLLANKKASMKILPTEEQWFGITYKEDRDSAAHMLQEKVDSSHYPRSLWRSS